MAVSIKALDTLIKIRKRDIDIKKAKLSSLVAELTKVQSSLIEIDNNIKKEKLFFSQLNDFDALAMQKSFDHFFLTEFKKQQILVSKIMKLHDETVQLQENLVADNQEVKKYEIIREKEVIKQKKEQEYKEEKSLEEIIINQRK